MSTGELLLPSNYLNRPKSEVSASDPSISNLVVELPELYFAADYLLRQTGRKTLLEFGYSNGLKRPPIVTAAKKRLLLDTQENVNKASECRFEGELFEFDVARATTKTLPKIDWHDTVIICANILENLDRPVDLLNCIKFIYDAGGLVLLSSPDRERMYGGIHLGRPEKMPPVREWTSHGLTSLFSSLDMSPAFSGYTIDDNMRRNKNRCVFIFDRGLDLNAPALSENPLGIVSCFNDADIIEQLSLKHLDEGLDLYFLDNWSDDGTYQILKRLQRKFGPRVQIERFPAFPTAEYEWRTILSRKAAIGATFPGRWIIHVDSDELRTSPWQGKSLREGLATVSKYGSNAVEFAVIEHPPLDDTFNENLDPTVHFSHCYFSKQPSHFLQTKAWLQSDQIVDLAGSGGHHAEFQGRKVFPYRFVLNHFPIRSTSHGLKKVLRDRKPRFSREEQSMGWHTHYDNVTDGFRFLSLPDIHIARQNDFLENYLLETITDVVHKRMMGALTARLTSPGRTPLER